MRMFLTVFLLGLSLFSCSHLSEPPTIVRRQQYVMGTVAFVEAKGLSQNQVSVIFERMRKVENLLTNYDPNSPVSQLNEHGEIVATDELTDAILAAEALKKLSKGHFDIRVGELVDGVYAFKSKKHLSTSPPDQQNIEQATKALQRSSVDFENGMIKLPSGVKLDFGGIGKGYGVWLAKEGLGEVPEHLAIGIGGDIYCEHMCDVEIEDPFKEGKSLFTFRTCKRGSSVSTSGNYRNFIGTPKTNHLINPKTGYPQTDTASLTIVTDRPTHFADAMATALAIAPAEERAALAEELGFSFLHVSPEGKVEKGPNFASHFCEFRG